MMARYIPNIITALRLIAVPPAIYFLSIQSYANALWIFAFAGVSDGVDGYLARRFSWQSHWGRIMDPLADKVLVVSTAAMLAWQALVPLWLFVLLLFRDVMLLAGSALYHWFKGPFRVTPTIWGKLSTFFQILLLVAIMAHEAYGLLSDLKVMLLMLLCGLFTLISGAHYFTTWIRKAAND
ncbi:CDP-alcohol phosphatidyltransferase family protein [Bermanella marisrubri]|uniref:CDP-diacylglycerol--glycerol-3-phosphate 3-phosphatidyltransferase n=1 Tax=Bermanella marisrubri TaxID=207949 RepID=Q1N6V8_9GAMM|nr:CDP-alcohol phosphatidyltransferase family protein [Bermanella marisrubri]EAT13484.1 CDP-alcohol phosphatidyltransferase [Oceanobacter sp. RED65] [Bermanella marisrubri]QIZ84287.1 CDP-alcohol phosphatidyltransferase family protein [Bermanella marisrubri]